MWCSLAFPKCRSVRHFVVHVAHCVFGGVLPSEAWWRLRGGLTGKNVNFISKTMLRILICGGGTLNESRNSFLNHDTVFWEKKGQFFSAPRSPLPRASSAVTGAPEDIVFRSPYMDIPDTGSGGFGFRCGGGWRAGRTCSAHTGAIVACLEAGGRTRVLPTTCHSRDFCERGRELCTKLQRVYGDVFCGVGRGHWINIGEVLKVVMKGLEQT